MAVATFTLAPLLTTLARDVNKPRDSRSERFGELVAVGQHVFSVPRHLRVVPKTRFARNGPQAISATYRGVCLHHDSEHSCDLSILLMSMLKWCFSLICDCEAIEPLLLISKRTGAPTLAMLPPQHYNEQVRHDITFSGLSPPKVIFYRNSLVIIAGLVFGECTPRDPAYLDSRSQVYNGQH